MEIEEEIEVKHVKDIIQFYKTWNEGDRYCGDGEWEHEARLIHIYETEDKIFKVSFKGNIIESGFKK